MKLMVLTDDMTEDGGTTFDRSAQQISYQMIHQKKKAKLPPFQARPPVQPLAPQASGPVQ